jgi:hypothetical protein
MNVAQSYEVGWALAVPQIAPHESLHTIQDLMKSSGRGRVVGFAGLIRTSGLTWLTILTSFVSIDLMRFHGYSRRVSLGCFNHVVMCSSEIRG